MKCNKNVSFFLAYELIIRGEKTLKKIRRILTAAIAFVLVIGMAQPVTTHATTSMPFDKSISLSIYSGIGAWENDMTIKPNGKFKIVGHDADASSITITEASGHFYDIKKSGRKKYTFKLKNSNKNNRKTKTEIEDGGEYIYNYKSGYKSGTKFTLYLPGYPVSKLPKMAREYSTQSGQLSEGLKKTKGYVLYAKEDVLLYVQ